MDSAVTAANELLESGDALYDEATKENIEKVIAAADPSISEIARVALAQIALGVLLTSIITPILIEKYAMKRKMQKRSLNM